MAVQLVARRAYMERPPNGLAFCCERQPQVHRMIPGNQARGPRRNASGDVSSRAPARESEPHLPEHLAALVSSNALLASLGTAVPSSKAETSSTNGREHEGQRISVEDDSGQPLFPLNEKFLSTRSRYRPRGNRVVRRQPDSIPRWSAPRHLPAR